MNELQVAKVVALMPQLLGCSGKNLEPKVRFLLGIFTSDELHQILVACPQLIGYRFMRLHSRVSILVGNDQLSASRLVSVMRLTPDRSKDGARV